MSSGEVNASATRRGVQEPSNRAALSAGSVTAQEAAASQRQSDTNTGDRQEEERDGAQEKTRRGLFIHLVEQWEYKDHLYKDPEGEEG